MEEADKRWALTALELKDAIREAMQEADIFGHYPALYYLTNGLMCHGFFLEKARMIGADVSELFIADPEMADTTEKQIDSARKICAELQAGIETDELMRSRLTVFSDVPASDIPDIFVESRRWLQTHEEAMAEASKGLIIPGLVYNPAGRGPGSRSYPYMGAHPGDDNRNFGHELEALRHKDVSRADYELSEELKELRARLVWAQQGCAVLRSLNLTEDGVR
jgi:hypothetical protein